MVLGDENFYGYEYGQAKGEAIKIGIVLKNYYRSGRMKEITKLIGEAERSKENEKAQALMGELKMLADELKDSEG